jgi:hypothetical protein
LYQRIIKKWELEISFYFHLRYHLRLLVGLFKFIKFLNLIQLICTFINGESMFQHLFPAMTPRRLYQLARLDVALALPVARWEEFQVDYLVWVLEH